MENRERNYKEAIKELVERAEADFTRWSGILERAMTVDADTDSEHLLEAGLIRLFDPKDNSDIDPDDYDEGKGHRWVITWGGVFLLLDYNPDILFNSPILCKEAKFNIRQAQMSLKAGVN